MCRPPASCGGSDTGGTILKTAPLTGVWRSPGLVKVEGDFFMGGFAYGDGIARYLNDLGGDNLDGVIGPDGKVHPLTAMAAITASRITGAQACVRTSWAGC